MTIKEFQSVFVPYTEYHNQRTMGTHIAYAEKHYRAVQSGTRNRRIIPHSVRNKGEEGSAQYSIPHQVHGCKTWYC